jgi:pimeloyl-ACP methyl ester carboxylesterase
VTVQFIYFHGFASSPYSNKAQIFKAAFGKRGLNLTIPDLDGGNFECMTLSSQIKIIENCLSQFKNCHYALIGSSMGGYLAALVSQLRKDIDAIYLMAPAFEFLTRWNLRIEEQFGEKNIPDNIKVFHYRHNKEVIFQTKIFEDAKKWEEVRFFRKLPIRIAHGMHDDSVPIEVSRRFISSYPWATLEELDSDHGLGSHAEWLADDCICFFQTLELL